MVSEMGLSADFIHEKTGFGNFWGVLGRWGWFRPKTGHPRWATSLPHRERGSPRLGKPHTWRISARSWPTLKYVTWVWYSWDQGWVIRTSETFNTVKYALISNTRIIRCRILLEGANGGNAWKCAFLHSEGSHSQPLHPIDANLVPKCSWNWELPENVLSFMWVALRAKIDWIKHTWCI